MFDREKEDNMKKSNFYAVVVGLLLFYTGALAQTNIMNSCEPLLNPDDSIDMPLMPENTGTVTGNKLLASVPTLLPSGEFNLIAWGDNYYGQCIIPKDIIKKS